MAKNANRIQMESTIYVMQQKLTIECKDWSVKYDDDFSNDVDFKVVKRKNEDRRRQDQSDLLKCDVFDIFDSQESCY